MEIEQRYVIKFFIDKSMKPLDILMRLHKNYGPRAFSRSTLYFWIGEARRGRTDLSEIPGRGRTSDEDLATVIARRHEQNPYLSARKLAQSLRISPTTICHYLSDVLGLKCLRLRWVPHTLTVDQKAKRVQHAEEMLQILDAHQSQDSISCTQVTSPGCFTPITNRQDELPRGMMPGC
jgi:AraC-like DNA-binding protein